MITTSSKELKEGENLWSEGNKDVIAGKHFRGRVEILSMLKKEQENI